MNFIKREVGRVEDLCLQDFPRGLITKTDVHVVFGNPVQDGVVDRESGYIGEEYVFDGAGRDSHGDPVTATLEWRWGIYRILAKNREHAKMFKEWVDSVLKRYR
jgi:hypothetical protein